MTTIIFYNNYIKMEDLIYIIIDKQKYGVDKRIMNMSGYFKDLIVLGDANIELNDISPAIFKKIIEFCQINKYIHPQILKVKSNELKKAADQINVNFIQSIKNNEQLMQLFAASHVLHIKSLNELCAAAFAVKLHFRKNEEKQYKLRKNELNINEQISTKDSKQYKQFTFMN